VVLVGMGDRIKVLRDWALLPIGVRRGLRDSELSAINCRVGRSDSGGDHSDNPAAEDRPRRRRPEDRHPFGRTIHCPVEAVGGWLSRADQERSSEYARIQTAIDILYSHGPDWMKITRQRGPYSMKKNMPSPIPVYPCRIRVKGLP
jgi:hypothetical protein